MRLPNIPSYLRDVRHELKTVQWPTRQATVRFTVLIIVVSAAVAAVAGAFDYLLTFVVQRLLLR